MWSRAEWVKGLGLPDGEEKLHDTQPPPPSLPFPVQVWWNKPTFLGLTTFTGLSPLHV